MTTSLKEDGIFQSYVDAYHLRKIGCRVLSLSLIAIAHIGPIRFGNGLYYTPYL